jgi:glycosyltransferase involved in cell wall biosynthesis
MNTCTVAYAFYETDFRVRRYAESLRSPGSHTDAIALQSDGKPGSEILNGVHLRRIQKRKFDEQGGPLDYIVKMGFFFVKASWIILVNHFRYHYDIIIVHNVPDFFVFTAFIPRLLGAKVILDIHDILPEFFCQRFHKPANSVYSKILRVAEYLSVKFSSFVITGNDLWRKKISARNHFPLERTIGFVNYPHLQYFRDIHYAVRETGPVIVYPGHLSHHHGVDIAVRAMPVIKQSAPGARLEIYAASWVPEYRTQLEADISSLGLGDSIAIHPPLDIDGLVEVYKRTDIGVVPKRGGIFASEAFSSKILDFMASGIPIVASRTTVDEHYFDGSMLEFFEPENHQDLARGILALQNDPARKKTLSENGKRYALENNWDVKERVFLEIVDSL